MGINRWWQDDPEQRYWLEVTGRSDIGVDLHAPQTDEAGRSNPTYALVREVGDDDVIFHYEKQRHCIALWSIASGGSWEAETVWGTPRSTGPAGHPVRPYVRPGLWHGLHGPFALPDPLTLDDLRETESTIAGARAELEAGVRGSVYFPFQLRRDGVRAAQGYLFKMPLRLVSALPKLLPAVEAAVPHPVVPSQVQHPAELGEPYRPVDEDASQPDRDPFPVDPALVERGTRSHARLQNALAGHLARRGIVPKRPSSGDPPWDLLWHDDDLVWVAEVKSLTARNEERQLRLGLGQLLRYRHRLAGNGVDARGVLMVERRPSDPEWQELCTDVGITLVWPESLRGL